MTRFSIIKWLEIAFSCVIFGLTVPGINVWEGYTYMFSVGCIGLIFVLLSLIFYVGGMHKHERLPHVQIEYFMNVLCLLLNLACFGLAVYDAVQMGNGNYSDHSFPTLTHRPEWRDRIAVVSAFSAFNAILFFLTCSYADQSTFKVVLAV